METEVEVEEVVLSGLSSYISYWAFVIEVSVALSKVVGTRNSC